MTTVRACYCRCYVVILSSINVEIMTRFFIVTGVVYTRLLSGYVIVGLMVMFCAHDYRQGMLLML